MFGFGLPPAAPKLVSLLEEPNPSLQAILSDDSCIRAFRQNFTSLSKFINERAVEVLACALSNDPNALRAYQLFGVENDSLLITISNTPSWLDEVSKEVFNENPDEVYINRFAHITELIALKKPSLLFKDVSYVDKFFPYIHLRAVYGIFESLFVITELSLDEVQNQMSSSDFLEKLLDYLKSISDSQDPYTEGRASSIYKLISLMSNSDKMKPKVQDPKIIPKLLLNFAISDPRILENKWQAVYDVLSESTANLLMPEINTIIGFLDFENTYYPHQVIAINLLVKLALNLEEVRKILEGAHIEDKFVAILQHFPQYTFAHLAIKNYCIQLKDYKELSVPVIKKIIDFANIAICDDTTAVVTRAIIWELVAECKKQDVLQDPIAGLSDTAKEILNNLDKLSETQYGGEVPENQPVGDDGLSSLTPEQIMTLLRFLTSGH
ncbi:hypothetical protein TVAG_215070 [Trichomonas vaginalis G3]|uniref:Uncharacterized protein n=1 Tax=Trichomonas vaginalis (strain ATCC PRA-98 / G3) TaxID=412133 RepID=A2F637_TRIV3|nr:armadillo (ARM) repeat-containing protein [Trichomonas vaginalis G3]EAX99607.1 hypothetical protein TVAG_215070 [Trichomonas vaginalis G3]KAI5532123.1 armadillo (ARM) repeat-containing protein [Trichomonas vaginalis G3]|eukprot:XP_001312537.1 hypothetical protein [Trichomonas vaginalis G3]